MQVKCDVWRGQHPQTGKESNKMRNVAGLKVQRTPPHVVSHAAIYIAIVFLALTRICIGQTSTVSPADSSSSVDLQILSTSIASDSAGDIYFIDTAHSILYKVSPTGVQTEITCCAGLSTSFNQPRGVAIDAQGNLYIANTGNNNVIEINTSGQASLIGNIFWSLSRPAGVAIDSSGDIYIADSGNNRIIEISGVDGQYSVVNTGSYQLSNPSSVSLGQNNTIYIADTGNNRIIEIPTSGSPSEIFSNQVQGPLSISVDSSGSAYIAQEATSAPAQNTSTGGNSLSAVVASFSPMNVNIAGGGGSQGAIASTNITLTPVNGFNKSVSVSVVGLPQNVIMQISHPVLSFQGNSIEDLLQVAVSTTTQQSRITTNTSHSKAMLRQKAVLAGLLPVTLLLIGFYGAPLRLKAACKAFGVAIFFLLLPILAMATSGCAGGYPAGLFGSSTYTATVIATPAHGKPYSIGSFGITVLN